MGIHKRSIRATMGIVFLALALLGGLSVATSLWATRAQQHDALILNLAGRQRMLSQKMAREAWLGLQKDQDPRHLAAVHTTAHQFETGLHVLMDGGQITYAGTVVSVPAAAAPAFRAALEEVQATWDPLYQAAQAVLENEPGSPAFTQGAEDLEHRSDVILEQMDAAVRVYQAAAEARVTRLRWIQLAFLAAGAAVLVLGFGLVLSQVIRPVSVLEAAVRRMEEGDLDAPVRVRARNELGRLAGAFESMRGWVKTQIEEQTALLRLSQAFLATLEPQAIMDQTVEMATQTLRANQCALLMLEEDGESLICAAANGWARKLVGVGRVQLEDSDAGYVVRKGRPVIIENTVRETRFPVPSVVIQHGVRSALIVPMLVGDEAKGALVTNSLQRRAFTDEETRLLSLLANQTAIALERAQVYEELEESYVQTVLALANAMDARDTYTGDHSQRMATWAVATARELGYSEGEIQAIRWGALLHDIGKIGVPDAILLKPGELDDAEWEVIRRHPETGADIVAPVKKLADVAPVIRAHQEYWDGSGYPDGLAGEDIPLGARVLAVVDAYGAMIDERPYKPARSPGEAVAELQRCAGTQFDPQVVEAFLRVLKRDIDIMGGVNPFQPRKSITPSPPPTPTTFLPPRLLISFAP